MKELDVVIIGAGTSGLSARREVEKKTKNYLVVDDGPLGTTCARVGCMPSKVLIQVANDFHRRSKLIEEGIYGGEKLTIKPDEVMKHVRKLRDRFVRGVMSSMESWRETHLARKRARFVEQLSSGEYVMQLNDSGNPEDRSGEKIKAKNVVLAIGSKPVVPQAWKKYSKYFITTDEFFELEKLPEKVAVIGLGVIGLELGQSLSRIGIDVIGLGRSKSLGGLTDPEIQEYAAEHFAEEFEVSFGGANIVGEEDGQLVLESGDKKWKVDKVFLTMGRSPDFTSVGLDQLDIPLQKNHVPEFDQTTMQVGNTRIFIAGDVTRERTLLHEAADEGRIAGYNVVREKPKPFQQREFLGVTFSEPNIAIAGKTHKELTNSNIDFVTGEVCLEGFGRAIVMLEEHGLTHIYADKKTGRLLGAELFSPGAEHLSHLLVWSISANLTVHDVLALPFYHPVLEESLRRALRDVAEKVDVPAPEIEIFPL